MKKIKTYGFKSLSPLAIMGWLVWDLVEWEKSGDIRRGQYVGCDTFFNIYEDTAKGDQIIRAEKLITWKDYKIFESLGVQSEKINFSKHISDRERKSIVQNWNDPRMNFHTVDAWEGGNTIEVALIINNGRYHVYRIETDNAFNATYYVSKTLTVKNESLL